MLAKYLWITGSAVMALLGCIHLYLTFFTNAFSSGNGKMIDDMKSSSPLLTPDITMWKSWIGFNGSHSAGVIFIGAINLYLVLRYFRVLPSDHLFFVINILTIGFYVWLAGKYWFSAPLIGLLLTLACYLTAYILTFISK
ncbi:LIC_13387 family protein [Spirosoma fluminis]